MKIILATVLSLLSFSSFAQDEQTSPATTPISTPSPSSPPVTPIAPSTYSNSVDHTRWRLHLSVFGTGSNHTNYEVKYQGSTIAKADDTDKPGGGATLGAERDFNSAPLAFGGEITSLSYKYADNSPKDLMTSLQGYLVYFIDVNSFRFSGGTGLGFIDIELGENSATDAGIKLEAEKNIYGFVVSPRVAADFWISDRFSIGAIVTYSHAEGTAKAKLTNISTGATADLDYEFRRTWMSYGLRGMFQF